MAACEFADASEAASDRWVEVVLDGVVGPAWGIKYLPENSLEISFHLLPYLRCASNSTSSSRLLQASWLMAGFRWLCHLYNLGFTFICTVFRCVRWCCQERVSRRLGSSFSCRISWLSWSACHLPAWVMRYQLGPALPRLHRMFIMVIVYLPIV